MLRELQSCPVKRGSGAVGGHIHRAESNPGRDGVLHVVRQIISTIEVRQTITQRRSAVQRGRPAFHMNLVGGGGEGERPQEAIATIDETLVVRENGIHSAAFKGIRTEALGMDVTAEHEEEVRVVLQRVVDAQALRAECRGVALADDGVRSDNRAALRVGFQQRISPVEDGCVRRGVIRHVNDDEVEAAGAEEVVAVGIVRAVVTAVVGSILEARGAEILVVESSRARVVSTDGINVMIPRSDAIRDAVRQQRGHWVFQIAHGSTGALPLHWITTEVPVLHDVTHVADEDDVPSEAIVHHPLCLRAEGADELLHRDGVRASGGTFGVILRVRNGHDREVRAGRDGRALATIEGHGHRVALRISERSRQRRAGAGKRCGICG